MLSQEFYKRAKNTYIYNLIKKIAVTSREIGLWRTPISSITMEVSKSKCWGLLTHQSSQASSRLIPVQASLRESCISIFRSIFSLKIWGKYQLLERSDIESMCLSNCIRQQAVQTRLHLSGEFLRNASFMVDFHFALSETIPRDKNL